MVDLKEARANQYVWTLLINRYPELNLPSPPTIDEMVVAFLQRHDVFVTPVSSDISPTGKELALSLAAGAFVFGGARGVVGAAAAGKALSAQTKGTALQEWTSWKQWTLIHEDWNSFKSDIQAKYQRAESQCDEKFKQEEVQSYVSELFVESAKWEKRVTWFFLISAGVAILFAVGGEFKYRFPLINPPQTAPLVKPQ
jgi:hypothetical protein